MGATILLMAETQGNVVLQSVVVGSLLAMFLITLICLLAATQLQRLLGVTGLQVISHIIGVLLAALAVQFVFDGIATSGLIQAP